MPLCEAYLRHKRYMEAMLVCKKGIKNLPNDPRGRLLLARVYMEQGKPPKAEQELITMLEIFPDNVDGLMMQGLLYKQGGRKSDAIAVLQRVFLLQPGRTEVKEQLKELGVVVDQPAPPPPPMPAQQQGMGQPMMMQGQMQNQMPMQQPAGPPSVDSFFGDEQEAAATFTNDTAPVQAPRSQTRIMQQQQRQRGAKILLSVVGVLIIGFGSFLGYYLNYVGNVKKIDALVREARPNFEQNTLPSLRLALKKYEEILAIDEKQGFALGISAYLHHWLAYQQLVEESKTPAAAFLKRAETNGDKEDNQYRISAAGLAKIAANDAKGAVDLIEPQAGKFQSPVVFLTLGEAYAAMGDETKSREALTKASTAGTADNATLVRLGEANIDEGKYDAAKGYFDQVLNQQGGHPGALIGRVYSNIGKKVEALDAAEKDVEKLSITPAEYLTPRWKAGLAWGKGLVDVRRNRAQDAQKNFDEAQKIDPNNLRNLQLRAKVYTVSGMHAEAAKDFQAVLTKRPNNRPAQVGLALAYATLGKSMEAGQIVEQLLAKDPNDLELQIVRAQSMKAQNKLDDAIAALQKVLSLQKSNVDAKMEIGRLLRQKKDYKGAVDHYTGILTANEIKGKAQAGVYFELARSYQEQGNSEKAKEFFFEAIKKDQDFADTYFYLAKILKTKAQKEALQQYLKLAPSGAHASDAQKMLLKK
ncbi:MAG: tetratricopeptide repeat protein [Deltaproteobacteria bacterium]|nr:tetratricopeptide repeat protein [Deltaproteobacteria bacterium]